MTSPKNRSDTPTSGNPASSQPNAAPYFLLDENLSPHFADALSAATASDIASVRVAFPGRKGVPDEELVPHISRGARHRGVWVTTDMEAQRARAKLIIAAAISVLWLREPRRSPLTGIEELLLLTYALRDVHTIVSQAIKPVYLQTSLVRPRRPKLETLQGSLYDAKLIWTNTRLIAWD